MKQWHCWWRCRHHRRNLSLLKCVAGFAQHFVSHTCTFRRAASYIARSSFILATSHSLFSGDVFAHNLQTKLHFKRVHRCIYAEAECIRICSLSILSSSAIQTDRVHTNLQCLAFTQISGGLGSKGNGDVGLVQMMHSGGCRRGRAGP